MILDHLNTWIEFSNPARGMDVCSHFCLLCYPLYRPCDGWADLPSKESYQNI